MIILGIETSCDETGAALIKKDQSGFKVLSNVISSQLDEHREYGGVVPEMAARSHTVNILPVVDKAFKKANLNKKKDRKKIDIIAVTQGPGLITSLMVGVETAKSFSYAWNTPLVPVNHIEGHIYANLLSKDINPKDIRFPALILTVSGGHTMLVLMRDFNKFKVIGDTRDDAAGEAFDKAAKLMNIGYPGGPAIAQRAKEYDPNQKGVEEFPMPMLHSPDYDFSFSGLKTSILYRIKKDNNWKNNIPSYCYEFQKAIVDILVAKTIKAAKNKNVKTIMLAGGVSANKELRKNLKNKTKKELNNVDFYIPEFKYTTDNAAMIATAGYFRYQKEKLPSIYKVKADSNLSFK